MLDNLRTFYEVFMNGRDFPVPLGKTGREEGENPARQRETRPRGTRPGGGTRYRLRRPRYVVVLRRPLPE